MECVTRRVTIHFEEANGKTIDWQKKGSARAEIRMAVKIILKKHKYPMQRVNLFLSDRVIFAKMSSTDTIL